MVPHLTSYPNLQSCTCKLNLRFDAATGMWEIIGDSEFLDVEITPVGELSMEQTMERQEGTVLNELFPGNDNQEGVVWRNE